MHVLATWELGRGYGHLGILASVSRALRSQGHTTSFAARYPQTVAATCAGDFDAVLPAPRFDGPFAAGETLTYPQVITAGGFGCGKSLQPLVARWLALFDRVAPDAVLAEHAPASLVAARIAGIPARRIGSSFIAPAPADLATSLLPWRDVPAAILAGQARVCDAAIAAASHGAVGSLEELLAGAPRFATTWAELDHFARKGSAGTFYGDLGGLRSCGSADWPAVSGPRVLVYMPADRGAGPALREALCRLRWPTLWHWPGALRLDASASDPDETIRFSPEPLDLDAAARSARLFVGRAGHGASAVMMRAGVAQLLVPDTLEALLLAYRLRSNGLASTRPGDATASDFARSLVQLASGELDGALELARRKYARYDPALAARRIAAAIASIPPARGAQGARSYTSLGR